MILMKNQNQNQNLRQLPDLQHVFRLSSENLLAKESVLVFDFGLNFLS